jgi:DNA ligase-1
MKQFAQLFRKVEETNKTKDKVDALVHFFNEADDSDKLWTIALFSHRRPRRTITTSFLREWASEMSGVPTWLFEESYHIVGDLAETISLVLPNPTQKDERNLSDWIEYIQGLREVEEEEKKQAVFYAWKSLNQDERFLFNKLITGGFRIGISQKLMTRALSKHLDKPTNEIAHRLMGNWTPDSTDFQQLLLDDSISSDTSKPYPFYLAYAVEEKIEDLGDPDEWTAEWKWDGIRGQVICRESDSFIWSRGEELVTDTFPEIAMMATKLPEGTVIDGEILGYENGSPLSFQALQKRIGRKKVTKKLLKEAPVVLMAYDLLECKGEDITNQSLEERRLKLAEIVQDLQHPTLVLSESVKFQNWETLAELRKTSRERGAEGFMLKKKASPYLSGRKKGDWWKWKVDPYTIDAVMLYAQRGHGRRSSLYTDFTFAVWNGDRLVTFAKAYSGLTDKEFKEITAFVKNNTIERFGPVSSVKPELVFELAFEGIQESKRHKSGVALRFPRIKRWRRDKPASEANHLEDLKALLP